MRFQVLILSLLLACFTDGATFGQGAAPPEVSFEAKPTGTPLQRDLLVRLRDPKSGAPVTGAAVAVDVDMPSMPMAHNVPRTQAAATSQPGEYAARVMLEMPGEWAAKILIGEPARAIATRKFMVTEQPAAQDHKH